MTALDLDLDTERGPAATRLAFDQTLREPGELRAATVALARRARGE